MMKVMRFAMLGSLLVAPLAGACASTPTAMSTADSLAGTLIAQLEQRVDLRTARVYVAAFLPCDVDSEGIVRVRAPTMAKRHAATSRLLRHQMMGALAPRTNVVDDALAEAPRADETGEAAFERAASLGASLILVGNFVMEGEEMLVMLRVVDVAERTILVATQGLVPHLKGAQIQGMVVSKNYRTLFGK